MRSNYPLSSLELNDKIFGAYENLIYLLGYENTNGTTVSGHFDKLDNSASNCFLSGILGLNDFIQDNLNLNNYGNLSGYMDIADFLKIDYIYRKHFETEE